ncbi:MAG: glycosyltransferase [Actinobacteria bacterium]|nr:glycosyltransferase [Actinomycetota bacterium]
MPDVSVVISTYDRVAMLREALWCALAQRDVDLEVVVVDNGSTDGTQAYLAEVSDPRVRVIRNDRSLGPTGGRNTGLAAAVSPWVAFLDDDDLWSPDKLRRQLEEAERTGAGWVYCGCVYIDADRRILGGRPPLAPADAAAVLPRMYVVPAGLSGMLFRRDRVDGDGLLDDRLRWQTDWDLSLRLLRTGPPAAVSAPLVAYRQHAGQVSQAASRYEPELEVMERKFADLRQPDQPFDRGVQHRFVASEALRSGQRRMALRSYAAAVRMGDTGSLLRSLALWLPRRLHPWLRRRLLSDPGWLAEAGSWLDELPAPRRRVVFVHRTLRRYRVRFFSELRTSLAEHGVDLELLHANRDLGGPRQDAGELPWATEVRARSLSLRRRQVIWLLGWPLMRSADLLVVEQASRLVLNVLLGVRRALGVPPPYALWGHGMNFDPGTASRLGERVKRWMTLRADWWFAYTRGAADIVAGLGFPATRITTFENATDTTALAAASARLDPTAIAKARADLGVRGDHTCLFLGNFAPEKRLDLLVAAGDLVRERLPTFELLMVGAGEQSDELRRAVASRPWLRLVGQRFGDDLADVASVCRLLLIPGWAGLSVVDSFALGLPIVISAGLPHPPEVEYIQHGVNGIVSDDEGRAEGYAATVVELLSSPDLLGDLSAGARASSGTYTLEAMVARVTAGIVAALTAVDRPASGHATGDRA